MSALFFATGLIVWVGLLIVAVLSILFLLWCYLSIAISYWWIRLKAEKLNPCSSGIKKEIKQRKLWRARLLIMIVCDYKTIIQFEGSTLHGDCWSADFTGYIPKLSAWKHA